MPDDLDYDTLAGKVAKLLGRKPAPPEDDTPPPGTENWKLDRVRREQDRARAAIERADAMEKAFEELQAAREKERAAWQTETGNQVSTLTLRHQEDLALTRHGFDGPGTTALRTAWEGQPKATRGASPSEWWEAQVGVHAAHLADPETAPAAALPKTLTPYLPTPQADTKPAPRNSFSLPAPGGKPADTGVPEVTSETTMESWLSSLRS